MQETRRLIFTVIQIGKDEDIPSRIFDFAIAALILFHIFLAVLGTFSFTEPYTETIYQLQLFSAVLFSVEYLLRVWTADYLYPEKKRIQARLKYIFSFTGIVDLFTFLPFYLPFFIPQGMIVFRAFRVVRIMKLFRVNPYYDALNIIAAVLIRKKTQLLSSVFIIFSLMLAASLCMYSLEHDAQPDVFSNAFSGIWWAASAMLTVGYGDMYPITPGGKAAGIILTFLGVGMAAIPTGILSAGFVGQMSEIQNKKEEQASYCPHCGKKL